MATRKSTVHNLIGQRFGRLVVISRADKTGHVHWLCRCDCGGEKVIRTSSLTRGRTQSCGCLQREMAAKSSAITSRIHGKSKTPEHAIWRRMLARCHCPTSDRYKYYGARGIAVCEQWRRSFVSFYEDMGPRPTPQHTVGRQDNDGPYSPENCRWETRTEQNRNYSRNRYLTHDGETLLISDWAKRVGFAASIIQIRIDRLHWSVDDALTIPPVYGRNTH